MRLDKYLKVSRIIKRRTIAKDACDQEKVTINGKIAKASDNVKVGDEIGITFGHRVTSYRVVDIKEHVRKEEATNLYEII